MGLDFDVLNQASVNKIKVFWEVIIAFVVVDPPIFISVFRRWEMMIKSKSRARSFFANAETSVIAYR